VSNTVRKRTQTFPLSHTLSLAPLSPPRFEGQAQNLQIRQAWISELDNKGSHQMSSDARSLAVRRVFLYLDVQKDAESAMDYEAPKGTSMRAGVNAKVSVVSEFTVLPHQLLPTPLPTTSYGSWQLLLTLNPFVYLPVRSCAVNHPLPPFYRPYAYDYRRHDFYSPTTTPRASPSARPLGRWQASSASTVTCWPSRYASSSRQAS